MLLACSSGEMPLGTLVQRSLASLLLELWLVCRFGASLYSLIEQSTSMEGGRSSRRLRVWGRCAVPAYSRPSDSPLACGQRSTEGPKARCRIDDDGFGGNLHNIPKLNGAGVIRGLAEICRSRRRAHWFCRLASPFRISQKARLYRCRCGLKVQVGARRLRAAFFLASLSLSAQFSRFWLRSL